MKLKNILACGGSLLLVHSFAFAQFAAATTALTNISTIMTSLGGAIVTIAFMYVGFKMVFHAAEWKDVAPVFWGGVLIGGAPMVGGLLGVA
jgi:type IV secretion system protein VirB2